MAQGNPPASSAEKERGVEEGPRRSPNNDTTDEVVRIHPERSTPSLDAERQDDNDDNDDLGGRKRTKNKGGSGLFSKNKKNREARAAALAAAVRRASPPQMIQPVPVTGRCWVPRFCFVFLCYVLVFFLLSQSIRHYNVRR